MKGSSFIFGLGCGIIFVTVVFYAVYSFGFSTTANTVLTMSDEEITDRATKLGMIFFDELPNTNQPDLILDEAIIERATALGMVFRSTDESSSLRLDTAQPTEDDNEADKEEDDDTPAAQYIDIYIPPGSSASDISVILQENGIIDDTNEFLKLVRDRVLTKKLRDGYFSLPVKGDYEDILNILRNKKPSS